MSPRAASQLKPTHAAEPPFGSATSQASIELYWLPLGAGGWFVKLNGRIWETIHARRERRRACDLYQPPWSCASPRAGLWSRTAGPSPTPTAQPAACSWKARCSAAGWDAGGCSATRCAAGQMGASSTPAKQWPAPSP
jgi:hypothetical protein